MYVVLYEFDYLADLHFCILDLSTNSQNFNSSQMFLPVQYMVATYFLNTA